MFWKGECSLPCLFLYCIVCTIYTRSFPFAFSHTSTSAKHNPACRIKLKGQTNIHGISLDSVTKHLHKSYVPAEKSSHFHFRKRAEKGVWWHSTNDHQFINIQEIFNRINAIFSIMNQSKCVMGNDWVHNVYHKLKEG